MHVRQVDVFLLCETWHDANSLSIHRLRHEDFSVVQRVRLQPLGFDASLRVNHGGVAIVAANGSRLTCRPSGGVLYSLQGKPWISSALNQSPLTVYLRLHGVMME